MYLGDLPRESSRPVSLSPRPMTLALTWRERSRGAASLSKHVSRYFQHTLQPSDCVFRNDRPEHGPLRFHLLQRWDTREPRTHISLSDFKIIEQIQAGTQIMCWGASSLVWWAPLDIHLFGSFSSRGLTSLPIKPVLGTADWTSKTFFLLPFSNKHSNGGLRFHAGVISYYSMLTVDAPCPFSVWAWAISVDMARNTIISGTLKTPPENIKWKCS